MSRSFRIWMAALAVAFLACFAASWLRPVPTAAAAAPADPSTLGFLALCDAYQRERSPQLLTELRTRHEFPPQEFDDVAAGRITVGMSRSGLVCARGWPQGTRSTTSSYGVTDWYTYTSPRLLVRLDDGRVHSFSD